MRKLQTKICHRSSTENSRKFNYYSGWISNENFQNCCEYEKTINTGKLSAYNSFPLVYHLLNFGEWMESYEQWMETYEQKNHVKNRVKFRYTRREVQILHAVHFRRISFAIEAERMILPFSKLLENGQDSEKTINMKKFRIFRSFSMVYYLPHSDKVCRNCGQNTFVAIFKID